MADTGMCSNVLLAIIAMEEKLVGIPAHTVVKGSVNLHPLLTKPLIQAT